jgi:drug/metabolite transporter (DMT)-like permease
MVQPLIPLAAATLSAVLRIERVDAMKAGGLLVSVVGTTITLRVWTNEDEAPGVVDAIFLMTQPVAYAVYVVLLALALKRVRGGGGDGSSSTAVTVTTTVTRHHEGDEDDDDDDGVIAEGLDRPPPGPMLFLFAATVVRRVRVDILIYVHRPRFRRLSTSTDAPPNARVPLPSLISEVVIASVGAPGLVRRVEWSTLPAHAYLAVLYAGVASSCFAHGINSWAISHVSGVLPTVYSGVQVIFTVILTDVFLDESVGWDRALGSVVTMCGVAVVSKAKANEQAAAAAASAGGTGTVAARRTSVDIGTEGGAIAILNLTSPGVGGGKAGAYRDLEMEMESVDEEGRASFSSRQTTDGRTR